MIVRLLRVLLWKKGVIMKENEYIISSLTCERIKEIISDYNAHKSVLIYNEVPISYLKKNTWLN